MRSPAAKSHINRDAGQTQDSGMTTPYVSYAVLAVSGLISSGWLRYSDALIRAALSLYPRISPLFSKGRAKTQLQAYPRISLESASAILRGRRQDGSSSPQREKTSIHPGQSDARIKTKDRIDRQPPGVGPEKKWSSHWELSGISPHLSVPIPPGSADVSIMNRRSQLT